MALYNVIQPCIVARKHYTRPSKAPVEVSEREARPLVEAGVLSPVQIRERVERAGVDKPHRARGDKSQQGDRDGETE